MLLIGAAFLISAVEGARYSRHKQDLLVPVGTHRPDQILFPPKHRAPLEPVNIEVPGALQTNKFWGNWIVNDGNTGFGIYPSPYTLKFVQVGDSPSGGLHIMKGETDYAGSFFTSHWHPDFIISAQEPFEGMHTIVKESHFGIHAQVRPAAGYDCTTTYPVYAGMAYPSAKYEGSCTPTVTSEFGLTLVEKVRPGVFRFQRKFQTLKEYRVYLLTEEGEFVDDSYDFNAEGTLNKKFNGWMRLADLQASSDAEVLDAYAQSILVGWELAVKDGVVEYHFETAGRSDAPLLNWAYANHMHFLDGGAEEETRLTRTRSPVKGKMFALAGSKVWRFKVDLSPAMALDFLPAQEPKPEHVPTLQAEAERDYKDFVQNWRMSMHKRDHYFSGKGFQKVGTVCHMLAKFRGKSDPDVQACANILKEGFNCLWNRNVSDGSDRRLSGPNGMWSQEEGCWWSPFGAWYDLSWGGIPSRWDDSPTCGLDFGNSCYNDHHYHWGYYVVSAAMLVDLMPSMADEPRFVDFINMFIRDVANPSKQDTYFPQFRAFDFFDMHSWSRGLKPDPNGKDQESTSEEINFHYGMLLWGKVTGNEQMTKLGATTLTLASRALQDYFLMKNDNPNHPASFSINHVTGIFFQNKVHLTTWFGQDTKYIHGIQMLPLTAGLELSRKDDFAFEEWNDQLKDLDVSLSDPWWSILFSGNMALWNPEEAWSNLIQMDPEHYDDGLTKSWALYWTSVQKADGPRPTPVPTPAPPPSGGDPGGPGNGVVYCAPGQYCPLGMICPASNICPNEVEPTPAPTPATGPTPAPTPAPPPEVWCNPNLGQFCPGGTPCPQCGAGACQCL